MGKFYVTTSIAYVNGNPHIGYAAELTQADALARWRRLVGDETFFLTGTDENSQKLIKVAEREQTTPQAIADKYAAQFQKLTEELNLTNDEFIRTTDERRHFPGAIKLWEKLVQNDLIYQGIYQGLYCVDCEQYYGSDEAAEGRCPIHETPLEKVEEENYFFRLSKFRTELLDLIESGKYEIEPEQRRNEALAFLKGELNDISFSRPAHKLEMGVPVPGDDSQRMYVWCDALTNYLTGVGYGTDEATFEKQWPADLHIIGKDIWKFHAVYWPAMLMGAGIDLPKKLYIHGFFTVDGKKMSKSKGNVIDPFELIQQHGADAVRYYLLRALPYSDDGDFSERHFTEIYKSELADKLGNLFSRVTGIIALGYRPDDSSYEKDEGNVPRGNENLDKHDEELKQLTEKTWSKLKIYLGENRISEAVQVARDLVRRADQYVDQKRPFELEGRAKENSIYTLAQVLGNLSWMYEPFIPGVSKEMRSRLGLNKSPQSWEQLTAWEKLPFESKVKKGGPLFPKSNNSV